MKTETTAGLPIEHANLTAPPLHIPDGNGGAYKTELVLFRSPERTEKINWWHGPDPRRDPHNHPWPFKSTILSGALTMTLWTLGDGEQWTQERVTYGVGDSYVLLADVFHTVDAVGPETVTHMECGPPAIRGPRCVGEWGYLVGGKYEPAKPDPEFKAALAAINPHMRK